MRTNSEFCVCEISVLAEEKINSKLEEKLKHKFDIEIGIVLHNSLCEIKANKKNRWVTICSIFEYGNFTNIVKY